MLARNFRPNLASWGGAVALKRRPSTPQEPSPEDDADGGDARTNVGDLKKVANDSDHETASAASSEPMPTPAAGPAAAAAAGVASSFARAGKLLWGGAKNPLSGLASLTKQHSRTVSDFSESDFTTPFAAGTPVWTRYGLGTVVTTRADDGFLIVTLQGLGRMTLYLNPADEDYYSVPAIRHDWVETPAGEGLVVGFDPKQQSYRVRLGSAGARSDVDVNVHRSDLRRLMPVRRQTHALHAPQVTTQPLHPQHQTEASVLTKGFNSAFKTIVTTSSGLSNSLSNYYFQGQCVVTTFGQGTIVALDQTSHRAQVQLTWGAMAFLSTDAVLHYTKALVGMEVATTKFGSGVVTDVRPADGMYTVRLHAFKDGEQEVVYVHESDLVRGGRRLRLGSAPTKITEKIGASTNKLFSFASSSTAKLFGHGAAHGTTPPPPPATAAAAGKTTPSPASHAVKTPAPPATTPSRSQSMRIVESDEEVSSAGI